MPEQYNTKRALQHLQRAQTIMQYGATQRKDLSSKGSLQFGGLPIETRIGERVYIKTIWKVVPGTDIAMKTVIKNLINTNTNFIIQALDINWTEVPAIRRNMLRIEIYTEHVHTAHEIARLEKKLTDKFDNALMSFDSEVYIYGRGDRLSNEDRWNWDAMPSMPDDD